MKARFFIISMFCLALSAASGCGRSDDGGPAATAKVPAATVISGMASKGPISGGTVKAFGFKLGVPDLSAPIGEARTDGDGNYRLDIGAYEGEVLLEVAGGSFTDEASGAAVTLKTPLRVILPAVAAGTTRAASVTPLTELAYRKAKGAGPITAASIARASAGIASLFGLNNIIAAVPMATGADDGQKRYAAACAVFSHLANNNKSAGEPLDDALARMLVRIGDEEERSGGLSMDTIAMINTAILSFNNSGGNGTGITIAAIPTPAGGLLKMSSAGAASDIFGIDLTIALPPGVSVDADGASGEAAPGVVTVSGRAAVGDNRLAAARYTPESAGNPARLRIILLNAAGFTAGEFVTIEFKLTTGAGFPAPSAFTTTAFSATAGDGTKLGGITAAPSSIAGL